MTLRKTLNCWLLASAFPGLCQCPLLAADPVPNSSKPKLYDTAADGKTQITEALKTAKAGNKRLILKFGANW